MDLILAHDFGTTALKAALYTVEGQMLSSVLVEYPTYRLNGSWAEQDPEDWWKAFCQANKTLLDDETRANVRCVSFDGTYPNCLCVDREGNPLHRAMIWQDGRATKEAEDLTALFPEGRLKHIPGHKLSQDRSFCKLLWLQRNMPEVYEKTYKMLPSVVSYILLRLTGEAFCDYDVGKGTAMLTRNRKDWDPELLALANIPPEILPQLRSSTDVVGTVPEDMASESGLAAGTQLLAGTCDNLCTDIGAGMVRPGDGYLSLGTSANVAILDAEGHRLGMATAATGSSLKWMIEVLGKPEQTKAEEEGISVYSLIGTIVESAPAGSHGAMFHPYLAGARSTLNNAKARGSFTGLNLSVTREDMMRSVVEGIGMNLCLILDDLRRRGNAPKRMNVVGGMAKSLEFLQIFADVFGIELVRLENGDAAAATGAAVLGGIALGIFEDHTAVDRFLTQNAVITPDPARHRIYEERMKLYRKVYEAQEPVYPELAMI